MVIKVAAVLFLRPNRLVPVNRRRAVKIPIRLNRVRAVRRRTVNRVRVRVRVRCNIRRCKYALIVRRPIRPIPRTPLRRLRRRNRRAIAKVVKNSHFRKDAKSTMRRRIAKVIATLAALTDTRMAMILNANSNAVKNQV